MKTQLTLTIADPHAEASKLAAELMTRFDVRDQLQGFNEYAEDGEVVAVILEWMGVAPTKQHQPERPQRPTCAEDLSNWLIMQRMMGKTEHTRTEIGDALERYSGNTIDRNIRAHPKLENIGHGRWGYVA